MGSGGSKGGTSTSSQTSGGNSTTSPPQWVLDQYSKVLGMANKAADKPFQNYGGEFVAPVNPTQQGGIDTITGAAGSWAPYTAAAGATLGSGLGAAGSAVGQGQYYGTGLGQAAIGQTNQTAQSTQGYNNAAGDLYGAGYTGAQPFNAGAAGLALAGTGAVNPTALTGDAIRQYESPYNADVVNATVAQMQNQFGQQRRDLTGNQILSGSFGSDRGGVGQGVLANQQSLALGQTVSGLYNQNYAQALQAAQQQQGVGLGAAQGNRAALQQGAGQLLGVGNQIYGQGTGTGQAVQGLGNQVYNQGLGVANQYLNTGNTLFGQGNTAAGTYANLGIGGANAFSGLGTANLTNTLSQGQSQIGAGTVAQQTKTAEDQARYNQFLQEQGYDFQTAQFLAGISEGIGALSGSSTTSNGSSNASSYTPQPFFSDERLKEDIHVIGHTNDGQEIIRFRYRGQPHTQLGLRAQDVLKHHPEAVGKDHGYLTVDYDAATRDAMRPTRADGGLVPRNSYDNGSYAAGGAPDMASLVALHQNMYPSRLNGIGIGEGPRGMKLRQRSGATLQGPRVDLHEAKLPAPPTDTGLGAAIGTLNKGMETGKNVVALGKGAAEGLVGTAAKGTYGTPGYEPPTGGLVGREGGFGGGWIQKQFEPSQAPPSITSTPLPSVAEAAGGRVGRAPGGGLPYDTKADYVPEDTAPNLAMLLAEQKGLGSPSALPVGAAAAPGGGSGSQSGAGLKDIASMAALFLERGGRADGLRPGFEDGGTPAVELAEAPEGLLPVQGALPGEPEIVDRPNVGPAKPVRMVWDPPVSRAAPSPHRKPAEVQRDPLEAALANARNPAAPPPEVPEGLKPPAVEPPARASGVAPATPPVTVTATPPLTEPLPPPLSRPSGAPPAPGAPGSERQRGADQPYDPRTYVPQVHRIEGGAGPSYENPRYPIAAGGPDGPGQFTRDTWNSFVAAHPADFAGMSPEQIMQARRNPTLAAKATQWHADQAVPMLQQAGIPVTQGNVYIAHGLGAKGGVELLRDPNRDALEALRAAGFDGVRQASAEKVLADNGGRPGMTAGQFAQTYKDRYDQTPQRAGGTGVGGGANAGDPTMPRTNPSATELNGPAGAATGAATGLVPHFDPQTGKPNRTGKEGFFDENGWLDRNQREVVSGLTFLGNMLGSDRRTLLGSVGQGLAAAAPGYLESGFTERGLNQRQVGLGQAQQRVNIESAGQLQTMWNNLNGKIATMPVGSPQRAAMQAQSDALRQRIIDLSGGAGGVPAIAQVAPLGAPAPRPTPAGGPTPMAPASGGAPAAAPPSPTGGAAPAGAAPVGPIASPPPTGATPPAVAPPPATTQGAPLTWWDANKPRPWIVEGGVKPVADYEHLMRPDKRPSYWREQAAAAAGVDTARHDAALAKAEQAEAELKSGTYVGHDDKPHPVPGFADSRQREANIPDNIKYRENEAANRAQRQLQIQNYQKMAELFTQYESGAYGGEINQVMKAVNRVIPNFAPENVKPEQADAILKNALDVTFNALQTAGGATSDSRFAGAQHVQPNLTVDPVVNRGILAQRLTAINQQNRMYDDYLKELKVHPDMDRVRFQSEWLNAHPMAPETKKTEKEIAVRGATPTVRETLPGGRGTARLPDTRKLEPLQKYVVEPIPGSPLFADDPTKPRVLRFIKLDDTGAAVWGIR